MFFYSSRLSQDRNVSVRCAARTMHHQSRLTTFLPRTHFRERSSNLLYHQLPNAFFAQWTVSFIYEIASGDISFRKYSVRDKKERERERVRKRRNERKTQLPRLSGIFPWGNSNVTVEYTAYLHYILLQFDLSYSQLCLVGEKVDMA